MRESQDGKPIGKALVLKIHFKVFEWCPISNSKTLSQTQMVSNTQN